MFVVSSELKISGTANEKETPADELAIEFTLLVEDSSAGRELKYSNVVIILCFCDTEVIILPAGLTPEDVKNCVGCDDIKRLRQSFPVELLCSLVKVSCAYIDEGVSFSKEVIKGAIYDIVTFSTSMELNCVSVGVIACHSGHGGVFLSKTNGFT